MDVSDLAAIAGAAAAVSAVVLAVPQYLRDQKWARARFVADLIKEFESKPAVVNSMLMLDYHTRRVEFFPSARNEADRFVEVTDEVIASALTPPSSPDHTFEPEEVAVRDAFCTFFDELDRFDQFVESGLISDHEVGPYLGYWLQVISGRARDQKPDDLRRAFRSFIRFYGYQGVENLLTRLGYPFKSPEPDPPEHLKPA